MRDPLVAENREPKTVTGAQPGDQDGSVMY